MPVSDVALTTHEIEHRYASPWTVTERVRMLMWEFCWAVFCRWTPKPLYPWRLFWLSLFGCKINGRPFVHQRARIQIPWHITLNDKLSIGDRANLYSLGEIEIGSRAVVAQEAYICTGTHDFGDRNMPLQTAKITIDADAFIGARSFVLPGVTIGEGAIVGACSLVTKDVPAWSIVAGSPARVLRKRTIRKGAAA
jgi:putative colanic acid biosynthesis acetyltransferase WcaF